MDNCLAPKHASALSALLKPEHELIHLREMFPQNIRDEDWIPKLSAHSKEWIIISGDWRITRSKHLLQVWKDSRLTGFFLTRGWTNIELFAQHSKLTSCLPKLIGKASSHRPGTGFTVSINGDFAIIYEPPRE